MGNESMNRGPFADERGFILIVMVAAILFVMCGIAGLAIDVSRVYMARAELQSAADACALAGARSLYFTNPPQAAPTWTGAETAANRFVADNNVEGKPLATAVVETGYWNISTAAFTPRAMVASPTALDSPAVRVTASKSSGNANGPLYGHFTKVVGFEYFEPSATAVATILSRQPIFPFAVSQCLVTDTLNGLRANVDLQLNGVYQAGLAGQWTTLTGSNAGDGQIRQYIDYLVNPSNNSAPPNVQVNTPVVVRNGTTPNLYSSTANVIGAGKGRVNMPIVACPIPQNNNNNTLNVVGFVPVQITGAIGGSTLSITGHLYPPQLVK